LNYVPVVYANQKPAIILVQPSKKELWRVLNASSGTFFDLRLLSWPPQSREVPLPVNVLAVDGVPAGPAYAAVARDSVLVPPGGRVEFVVTTPPAGMHAQLVTNEYDNGPSGDRTPYRVLANLRSSNESPAMPSLPDRISPPASPGFQSLESLVPVRQRMLYFSETPTDPAHPKADASYFVTIDGAKPKVFDMKSPTPSITATQGTVEDWTIENRASESHVFHIHQLHFQLLERDGKPCAEDVLRDTIELPYWDGKSAYPKIKIRMDFRDPAIVGIFPYHCHILEHEDGGMMGLIEIVRPPSKVNRK
jgi:FtsP/CotA-like multicopper oxidase with cupredoxin domain